MIVTQTSLPGVLRIDPVVHRDPRGFFLESWHHDRYREAGLPDRFVQDNLSCSRRGVLRGLHYQEPYPQGRLIWVTRGEVFDVAVDLRVGSPTFGRWVGHTVSATNARQIFVPPGFAHGFVVLSAVALFAYKCTEYYHAEAEATVLWNDPDLGIEWPVAAPRLSDKDGAGVRVRDLPPDRLPRFTPAP
ncbi:MAG: dTDP-4-dehydrorhamnose 3,5-epimerase [Gemmatimonadaceae bacterium]